MTTYVKLPMGIQDLPVGKDTVNQARDNVQVALDILSPEHGTLEAWRGPPPPTTAYGRHNSPTIPRAQLLFSPTTASGGGVVLLYPRGNPRILVSASSTGTGLYQVELQGLAAFWAKAEPQQTSSPIRHVHCQSYYPPAGTTGNGIIFFEARELSAGDFALAAFAFNATIYGTV